MRCASPPESVDERRSSVRYSRPTSFRNFRRWRISIRILSAMARFFGDSSSVEELVAPGDVHAHHLRRWSAADANVQRFGRRREPRNPGIGVASIAAQNTRTWTLYFLVSTSAKKRRHVIVDQRLFFIGCRSPKGTFSGPCRASFCELRRYHSYCGLVQGSTAPSGRATGWDWESPDPCRNRWCCRSPGSAGRRPSDC
jgi:hypothetical protein